MENSNYVGVVKIKEDQKEGGYWVLTSDDLPGLLLCGKDIRKLISDVPVVVKSLFRLNYEMDVEVRPMVDALILGRNPREMPIKKWAALPTEV